MAHIEDCLLFSLAQKGDRYVFGAEVTGSESDRWDCSELVEAACRNANVKPTVPDGAYWQWKHCKPLSVQNGVATRGALLFVGDGTGVGREAITHVAWSLGDGTTIEARGKAWGVGVWPTAKRFNFAGLIPGVDYSPRTPLPPHPEPPEDDVIGKDINSDRAGMVELAFVSMFGERPSSVEERNKYVLTLVVEGYDNMIAKMFAEDRAVEHRRKLLA